MAEPGEVDGAGDVEGFLRDAAAKTGAQDGVLVTSASQPGQAPASLRS